MAKTYADYKAEYWDAIDGSRREGSDVERFVRPETWILAKWEMDNGGWTPLDVEYHRELKRLVLADPPLASALMAGLELQLPRIGTTFEEVFPELA